MCRLHTTDTCARHQAMVAPRHILCTAQSWSRHFEEEIDPLRLQRIEPHFHGRQARNLVTMLAEIHRITFVSEQQWTEQNRKDMKFIKPSGKRQCVDMYRVIKKSLCTWWLQYRKLQVTLNVSPASLQTFTDTRLTLTPPAIPNSNYVIM
jgi:hypothetical protein